MTRMRRAKLAARGGIAFLCVSTVACDPPKKKPPPVVEGTTEPTMAEIREWLKRTRSLELRMVDCPVSVPVEKGYNFTCQAIAPDGSSATVLVEFVDRSGVTKMTLEHPIVVAAEIEAALTADAGADEADCGKRIRPAKKGATVHCTVDGRPRDVTITAEGDFRLAPPKSD
jgi:hypothetical protein